MIAIQDNHLAPTIGPSGNVHLRTADWAKFAAYHLEASRGNCPLVSAPTFARLRQERPYDSGYAAGWFVKRRAGLGKIFHHAGSDGWWYATIEIAQGRGVAVLAVANMGYPRGARACEEATRLVGSAATSP